MRALTVTITSIAVTLLLVGCGQSPDSPIAPTPQPQPSVLNIGGTWFGQLEVVRISDNFRGWVAMEATFEQRGNAITGRWFTTTAGADTNGVINGTLTGAGPTSTFSGSSTFESPTQPVNAGRCVGTMQFTGAAEAKSVRWTTPRISFSNCTETYRDFVFTVSRP